MNYRNQILVGDCIELMRELPDGCVDSVVTDPPYGLSFMGKEWDHGVPGKHFWEAAIRVAKPGSYLLAFGGTRTFHRLTCAIEDAGWEIRDCIMWVYGSGFPKSLNLSGEREGWGTALKPAWEPIIVARKPLVGTVAANVEKFGTGAMNIDGCRVEVSDDAYAKNCSGDRGHNGTRSIDRRGSTDLRPGGGTAADGRWPANLIHDGSDEVLTSFPQTTSGKPAGIKAGGKLNTYSAFAGGIPVTGFGDQGSAARFFYCAKASQQDRDEGLEHAEDKILARSCQAQAEADRGNVVSKEGGAFNKARIRKNNHPTVKPTALMRYLCKLITPSGGLILDMFFGSGSTGKAARLEGFDFLGIELSPEYAAIAEVRIAAIQKPKPKPENRAQLSLFTEDAA